MLTVVLVAFLPNISSLQINSTDQETNCFEKGINIKCFKKFLQPAAVTLNDTSSTNFLNALYRKINSEADTASKSRHKRRAAKKLVRREIRAGPYETNFLCYALAVQRLKKHFVSIIVVRHRRASSIFIYLNMSLCIMVMYLL